MTGLEGEVNAVGRAPYGDSPEGYDKSFTELEYEEVKRSRI